MDDFIDAGIAVALGLMIGLEREHHGVVNAAVEPREAAPGVRTFALFALAGWVAATLAPRLPWMAPAALLGAAALLCVPLASAPRERQGITTEVAALVTMLLGMLVPTARDLAVALGVVTALLLVAKPWVGKLVTSLRRADLTATLQVVVALAIVLPLLPTEARDPWQVLSPRRIGLFVTLIMATSWAGYVLTRIYGARRGAGLAGLLGGLVSSTAVTATMAGRARDNAALIAPGQLATLLACAVMSVRLLVICAVIAPAVALALAPPVAAIGLVMIGGAVWVWRRAQAAPPAGALELDNPTALVSALKWGVFMALVLVVAAASQEYLGDRGVLASAALSGLADVDAISLALSRGVIDGAVTRDLAVTSIVLAVAVNTAVKAGMAYVTGGRAYGLPLLGVFGAALGAGLTIALVS